MKCFLDMDGVLADFTLGFCQLHNMANPYENPSFHGVWDFVTKLPPLPGSESYFKDCGEEFFANLPPTRYFKDLLLLVFDYFDDVEILTAPLKVPGVEKGKQRWLKKHLPQLADKCHFNTRKHTYANRNTLLLDDADHNIEAFKKHGGFGVLFPSLGNSLHSIHRQALEYVEGCFRNPFLVCPPL